MTHSQVKKLEGKKILYPTLGVTFIVSEGMLGNLDISGWEERILNEMLQTGQLMDEFDLIINELNCTCTTYEWDLHSCPYQVEINDNVYIYNCTCCPFCEQQCNDDI